MLLGTTVQHVFQRYVKMGNTSKQKPRHVRVARKLVQCVLVWINAFLVQMALALESQFAYSVHLMSIYQLILVQVVELTVFHVNLDRINALDVELTLTCKVVLALAKINSLWTLILNHVLNVVRHVRHVVTVQSALHALISSR